MNLPIRNIAAHLPARALDRADVLAVVVPHAGGQYTFRQLDEESDRLAHGLEHIGIGRGVRTVLMVRPSLEFFALTFALFKVGAVPVLIDPGMGIKNLGVCLEEAAPEAFIGIPKAHAARVALGWGKRTLRVSVTVGRRWFWRGYTLDQVRQLPPHPPLHKGGTEQLPPLRKGGNGGVGHSEPYPIAPVDADQMAAILFTSGSTGVAKGAVYTHAIFGAQVDLLRRTYGIEPGEIDLCTFPLFALFAPALGMTAIVPDMDPTRPAQVDPHKIAEAIERYRVTNMFGSPALLNRVGRWGVERGLKLPTLRRAISAGAPVSAEVLERFARLLNPGTPIHTPYGATEALPVCTIESNEILRETRQRTAEGAGVCVGRPVESLRPTLSKVAIVRISDDAIPEWSDDLLLPAGEIGEIVVQGPVVSREYFGRPEATRLAKIHDPRTGTFYHRMGDVGYFDDTGRLWFCGRKSQRVVTPNGTLFTIPIEGIFNAHPHVYRSALVGVERNGARQPVLCVELEPGTNGDRETLRRELLELGKARSHTRDIQTILFHAAFPVDIRHNAKIFREKLAVWASRKLS